MLRCTWHQKKQVALTPVLTYSKVRSPSTEQLLPSDYRRNLEWCHMVLMKVRTANGKNF